MLLRFGECTAYHVRRYSLVVDHLAIVLKLAEPKQIPFARCILSILGRLGPRQELACVFIQRVSGLAAEFAIIGVPIFLVTIFTKPQGFVGSVGIYMLYFTVDTSEPVAVRHPRISLALGGSAANRTLLRLQSASTRLLPLDCALEERRG